MNKFWWYIEKKIKERQVLNFGALVKDDPNGFETEIDITEIDKQLPLVTYLFQYMLFNQLVCSNVINVQKV